MASEDNVYIYVIVSAYDALLVRCEESQNKGFWKEMNEVLKGIPGSEDIVIGGGLNREKRQIRL